MFIEQSFYLYVLCGESCERSRNVELKKTFFLHLDIMISDMYH